MILIVAEKSGTDPIGMLYKRNAYALSLLFRPNFATTISHLASKMAITSSAA